MSTYILILLVLLVASVPVLFIMAANPHPLIPIGLCLVMWFMAYKAAVEKGKN